MRGIVSSSLRLRWPVVAVAALLLGVGVWQLRDAPLDAVPEFSPLTLTVQSEALGLSSAEVEALITVPLEADLLNGVPWLESIESGSMTGVSTIRMHFVPGTDPMRARQMVQERLVQAPTGLPNVSRPPVLLQPVSSVSRVMNIGLSSKAVSLTDMTLQAQWNIVPRLVSIPGVANVSIWGRRDRQLQVEVAPETLHEHGITLEQVVKTVGEAVVASPLSFLNSSTPGVGGFIDMPNQRLSIRHVSPLVTPEDLARVPVAESTLTLGQIAHVVEGHQLLIGDAIVRGDTGLMLAVEKHPGANTQEVTRDIEGALEELRPGLAGIDIDTGIYRPASFLEQAAANLTAALAIAGALLAVGLFLLQGWRAALIAAVAIPLSLVAAWLVLHLCGVPLTMIAAAGLLLALGAVVHDAILDVDTIARRLRQARTEGTERSPVRTVLAAALEERRPMLSATLILLLAAAPMLLAEGRSADLLRPLAWSYIAAVTASMLVALTVAPALSALLLSNAPPPAEPREERRIGRLGALFGRKTGAALRSPLPAYGLAAVAVLLSFFAWTRLERDLLPGFKETDILVEWRGPEGISLPEMTRVTTSLIRDLRVLPGVRNAAAHIGRAVMCNCDEAEDVNSAAVWVSIDPRADRDQTLAAIHAAVAEYPGMSGQVGAYLSKKVREAAAGDSERRLTVRAYGYDPAVLRGKAEEIRGLLAQVSGVANPRLEPQAEEPTIEVDVDLERAAAHGFKPGDVRRATASLVGGITVGAVFEQQKVFEVVVWGTPDVRRNITDVQNIALETDGGTLVRLADVAQVRLASTSNVIRRHGASRRLDVIAEVEGRPVDAVAREVADRLKAVSFPLEHHAEVLGGRAGARSALRSVEGYAVAAAVLAFLLLQAALGSWRLAAAALVGLPVVVLGSTIAVLLGGGGVVTLGSVLGGAAALALTLRVTIAMVCRFQVLEREGMPLDEALVRRGLRERFPSTAATLLATGAAVVPFVALGPAAGLELAHPMAVAMLGGLVGSMVATLVMTPALYLRFGAGTAADTLGLEPPPAAAPEPAVR